jgi:hypothetical protein
MNQGARQPFWLALVASLLLHLVALTAPGWGLPFFEEDDAQVEFEATLVMPLPPVPVQAPVPSPPRRPVKKSVRPSPVVASSPAFPTAPPPAEPEPPVEPTAPAPEAVPESAAETIVEPAVAAPPAPTFAHADILPKSGRIVFQVTRGEGGLIVGQAEHVWRHDGTNYELRAVTETVGIAALFRPVVVSQESRGSFAATGLQPLEFRAERDGKPKESVRFDYGADRLTLSNGRTAAFPAGTQDLLSLFYQLGAYSFADAKFAVSVTSGRKISHFGVTVDVAQTLDTPLGLREVRHLRITGIAREDATEIWLDVQTRLPLKIRHRDRKGEIFDQIVTAIELEKNP